MKKQNKSSYYLALDALRREFPKADYEPGRMWRLGWISGRNSMRRELNRMKALRVTRKG